MVPEVLEEYLSTAADLAAARPPGPWQHAGATVAETLTVRLDAAVEELAPAGVTVVAVGGYGRRQMCLGSDVDLMILHDGEASSHQVQPLLYPFWDAKLKLGHSTRTVREAGTAAKENLHTLTAMLSGRVVAGAEQRWLDTVEVLQRMLRSERASLRAGIDALEMARRTQEPFHLLAPDVKDGRGGLRTAQSLAWIRAINEGEVAEEYQEEELLRMALVLSIRNALHATGDKPTDRYQSERIERVARWLGAAPSDVSDALYSTLRAIEAAYPAPKSKGNDPVASLGRWLVRSVRRPERSGMASSLRVIADVATSPTPVLDTAQRRRLSVEKPPSWNAEDRADLVRWATAGTQGYEVANQLSDIGWLSRVLPELDATVGRAQLAPFHTYQLDGHLWATAGEVVQLTSGGDPWCEEVVEHLGSIDSLLVAALFHDIGKRQGGDHSEVGATMMETFANRVGFDAATTRLLADAVRHHLLLPHIATRRDIDDPAVIRSVAATIKTPELLGTLAVLAVADGRATGTASWSDWKRSLVRTLYERLAETLGGHIPEPTRIGEISHLSGWSRTAVTDHIGSMPTGYLARYHADEIAQHLSLASSDLASGGFRLEIAREQGADRVLLVARDRPGTLADISGVLSLHDIDVLDARIATSKNGWGFDTFYVVDGRRGLPLSDHRWALVRSSLEQVFSGDVDLRSSVASRSAALGARSKGTRLPDIRVYPSDTRTIVEVRAADRTGLLYDISNVFLEDNLAIERAKLESRAGSVTDVFYLQAGARPEVERLRSRLTEVCSI